MTEFLKGADLSAMLEVERCGGRFYDLNGREDDAMRILARHGVNHIRLRLWNDPRSEAGESYGGGGYDLNTVTVLARRAKDLRALAVKYHKPLLVTETAAGCTLDDYACYEGLAPNARKGPAAGTKQAEAIPWPMTPEGQAAFLTDLSACIRRTPAGLGAGFVYWEPAWLPVKGSEWATPAGLRYLNDPGPGGNEWASQALFDYEGHALSAVASIESL